MGGVVRFWAMPINMEMYLFCSTSASDYWPNLVAAFGAGALSQPGTACVDWESAWLPRAGDKLGPQNIGSPFAPDVPAQLDLAWSKLEFGSDALTDDQLSCSAVATSIRIVTGSGKELIVKAAWSMHGGGLLLYWMVERGVRHAGGVRPPTGTVRVSLRKSSDFADLQHLPLFAAKLSGFGVSVSKEVPPKTCVVLLGALYFPIWHVSLCPLSTKCNVSFMSCLQYQ